MHGLHRVQDLDERECRALLATATLGRLGFSEAALPMILPAHYVVRRDEVVLASLSGARVACAGRGDVVVFTVDRYDPASREGWAVNVIGASRLVTDDGEITDLDGLEFSPWGPQEERRYIAVRMGLLRGRRLSRTGSGIDPRDRLRGQGGS